MELIVNKKLNKVLINDELYNTRDKACLMKDII
jgi:hypothetical protein